MQYVQQSEGGAVEMTVHDDRSLLALQGPAAVETLQPLVDVDLSKVYFSDFHKLDIAGIPCYLTRTGCALTTSVNPIRPLLTPQESEIPLHAALDTSVGDTSSHRVPLHAAL